MGSNIINILWEISMVWWYTHNDRNKRLQIKVLMSLSNTNNYWDNESFTSLLNGKNRSINRDIDEGFGSSVPRKRPWKYQASDTVNSFKARVAIFKKGRKALYWTRICNLASSFLCKMVYEKHCVVSTKTFRQWNQ